jgi:hypothetical protein
LNATQAKGIQFQNGLATPSLEPEIGKAVAKKAKQTIEMRLQIETNNASAIEPLSQVVNDQPFPSIENTNDADIGFGREDGDEDEEEVDKEEPIEEVKEDIHIIL